MWGLSPFDLERVAFYCQQCHTMAEGGAMILPEGIVVRCHGQTEEVNSRRLPSVLPSTATADEPLVVHVFKQPAPKPAEGAKRPNLRFYCEPDNKIIGDFLYQFDQAVGQVHVFSVKCTGEKCGNRDHIRMFNRHQLTEDQMYGDGPPLLIDLRRDKPVPHRTRGAAAKADPVAHVPSNMLPGVRQKPDPASGMQLPPTRLITLEDE